MTPPRPWRVAGSRYAMKDRWVGVRIDSCITPAGGALDYTIIEQPDFVHVVALTPDDALVLVRQYRHGVQQVRLELPAGRMDAGEEDPVAAGLRELREETGFSGHARLLASLRPSPARAPNWVHIVLAEDVALAGPQHTDPHEEIEVIVLPAAAWRAALHAGEIDHASDVAALFLALNARAQAPR